MTEKKNVEVTYMDTHSLIVKIRVYQNTTLEKAREEFLLSHPHIKMYKLVVKSIAIN